MKEMYSFPPIADQNSRILVVGTMPGKDSLRLNQYYANTRNSFWSIVFALFDATFSTDYNLRKALLIDHKIALWDTLKVCFREGSSDSAITDFEPNDLKGFLENHPNIKTVFCNGKDAALYFRTFYEGHDIKQIYLPSTSPAHAIGFERKLKEWSVIIDYLN